PALPGRRAGAVSTGRTQRVPPAEPATRRLVTAHRARARADARLNKATGGNSKMSEISVTGALARRGAAAPRHVNIALLVIAFAQLMVVLDTTIVNVALPSIQHALRFNP